MNKHIPVLLKEVLDELDPIINSKSNVYALDCTLGQAGHSLEIFQKINKGVLVSIDLDKKTIDWDVKYLSDKLKITECKLQYKGNEIEYFKLNEEKSTSDKTWIILQSDFSKVKEIKQAFDIVTFDFILADLGFSNYQLTKNLGISFDNPSQRLDMRYDQDITENLTTNFGVNEYKNSITASDVLNTYDKSELEKIFVELGQMENSKYLVDEIVNKRKIYPFEKVSDILRILNKPKYPKNFKYKLFQALRSFVNNETDRLKKFLEEIPDVLSENGKTLVITFNSIEEDIIRKNLEVTVREPNITEIIKNIQSRSAKLYIYKKKTVKDNKTE